MDLRQLRSFIVLAETLHFARAANRLNIVQSALSTQIRQLEEDFGTALFARTRRKVELTEAGRLFLPEAERTLRQADRARDVAVMAGKGLMGTVRIGFTFGAVYSGVLASKVARARRHYPGLRLEVREMHPGDQLELLSRHEIDVAFGTIAAYGPLPDGFVFEELIAHPACVALGQEHRLFNSPAICRDDLREEPFIGYSGAGDRDGMRLTSAVLGYTPDPVCRVSSPMTAVALARTGLGICVIPGSLEGHFDEVVFRRIDDADMMIDVTMMRRDEPADGALRAFLNAQQES